MGKIIKSIQAKHKESLSPWLQSYVESTSTAPLPLLQAELAKFPSRWPFGRGDLYHWIPLLNRFDTILERFCSIYELDKGPQQRDFGSELIAAPEDSADPESKEDGASSKGEFPQDADKELIEIILKFTRMLLEHCGNRSIYASSGHLNNLLNSTSWPVLIATLEVGSELAQRYQASVRRIGNASRQISSALLANHYNIDLERVQQLALPFVKTPIIALADSVASQTPGSSTKGKDRAVVNSKNSASTYANDLVCVATAGEDSWKSWGDVKVNYYPQEIHNTKSIETGRTSMPSTPTPLRRSSTMTSPHQSTPRSHAAIGDDSSPLAPKTPTFADDYTTSSQRTFEVPRSVVKAESIHHLLSRLPEAMPPPTKYETFHRLRVAKSLLGSREERQNMLAARLLAITNLAYVQTENTFVEKVLRQDVDETRRYQLVYQLADMVHPSKDGNVEMPLWLQTVALALLEALSSFHARCQDVLSALNANVSHGVLLYVLRKAVAQMKEGNEEEDDGKVTEIDKWRDKLLSLTLHLSTTTRVGNEMASAGLMELLVEILNMRTKTAQRYYFTVLMFLETTIWSFQSAFTAFFNGKGLEAVSQLVVDLVRLAKDLQASGQGTPPSQQSSVVDYEVPFYQRESLRWLLKFIDHIMTSTHTHGGNTARLIRNLADESDLLASLRRIMEDPKAFGSVVWSSSVTILSDFINNDPTSFAAISESGMVKSYLASLTGQTVPNLNVEKTNEGDEDDDEFHVPDESILSGLEKDERPHPPSEENLRDEPRHDIAQTIIPSTDAIQVIPQVLNAICLNNTGLKMVVASRAFDSFFEIFESPRHVKILNGHGDLAYHVGTSFDELARHHPSLRTSISNSVIDMVARVRYLGIRKAPTWGARLFLTGKDNNALSITKEGEFVDEQDSFSKAKSTTGDADVDMTDAADVHGPEKDQRKEAQRDSPEYSYTPYVLALANFMSGYIGNANALLKTTFIRRGGLDLLLDICESPGLSIYYEDSAASRYLSQVIGQLIDFSPSRGLPSLLHRAQVALDLLEPIAHVQDESYFGPFLSPDLSVTNKKHEAVKNGTRTLKALLNAQTLLKTISECFPPSRSNNATFYPINVYDLYLKLVSSIGPLLRGLLAEEAAQLNLVPLQWSLQGTKPANETIAPTQSLEAEVNPVSLPSVLNDGKAQEQGDAVEGSATEGKQNSLRFQNFEAFKVLLHPMIPMFFPLFQALGKALLPRRDQHHGDLYPRPRQLEIAQALANAVLGHLRSDVGKSQQPTSKDFHYWIIMLHTLHTMLADQQSTRVHPERPNIQLIMPVLMAFKEEGGLDVLNKMLHIFAETVREGQGNTHDKVAAFGLKKILDLYLVLVNGKYVVEAGQSYNLQRQTDRSRTVPNIFQQFVVEVRFVILSAVAELWKTSLVDKVSDATIRQLLETLKTISAGDSEPSSTPPDKAPFNLLQFTDYRFNWRQIRNVVDEVRESRFEEELLLEAAFRTNGSPQAMRDYCCAYRDGVAGPRHPIPLEDADASGLAEPRSGRTERAPSDGTASSDPDRMSLDDSPHIGEVIDRSPLDVELGREDTAAIEDSAHPPANQSALSSAKDHTFVATKADLDEKRDELRKDLIDRCLDVVRSHPKNAIEVSEFIATMVLRSRGPEAHEEACETLSMALLSLDSDDDLNTNGRCIAAYAHLLALLFQESNFLQHNEDLLRSQVDGYTKFLAAPAGATGAETPPWYSYILLILETLLCRDARLVAADWKQPKSINDTYNQPVIQKLTPLVDESQQRDIMDRVLDLLPRVGKDEVLATSILRVLVLLTRKRALAKFMGEKKSLQRLFLMAKQLSSSGSERLKQNKVTSQILLILRHIVEDDEVTKQIIHAEIKSEFLSISRSQRGSATVNSFLQHMAPLALRAPDLFVEATNELVEFSKWTPPNEASRSPTLVLKDLSAQNNRPDNDTEDEVAVDVKPSTEPADKEMADAPRTAQDQKRPVVENPDGVIHFLLSELVNYRDVDDKEPSVTAKDADQIGHDAQSESAQPSQESKDVEANTDRDKKASRPIFKVEEHPIFIYRCFLLNCLTELLQSYTRTKIEFINFKRSAPPLSASTPVKPRSSVLNYLIYDLLCSGNLSGTAETVAAKKRAAVAAHTQKVLVALVSKTRERAVDRTLEKYSYDDEPDLLFIRKFVLDTLLKAYERAPLTDEPLETRYSRMQSLTELMNHMIGERDKEHGAGGRTIDLGQARSQAQLRRLMYEKGFIEKLTSSIAEINLNYPSVKRAIKYILRTLRTLTETAKQLSHSNLLSSNVAEDAAAYEDDGSASSLSNSEDEREETPDLYRNSSLGMLEPRGEESDDEEDDGEDMYGDEYGDEMDYDEEDLSEGDEEDFISEDSEMGEIEGLSGEPGMVEVVMDEDDDDDDEDDSDEEDDEDEMDSDDMEDVEDQVEIVDEDGHPIEDDGASGWESEVEGEEDEEVLEGDFEGEDVDYEDDLDDAGAHDHGMEVLADIMREGGYNRPGLLDDLDHGFDEDIQEDDDDEEEDEDIDDEDYNYDDDLPIDDHPAPIPGLGWDGFNPPDDQHVIVVNHHGGRRRGFPRMESRSPLPPGFLGGRGDPFSDFRSFFTRHHRTPGPSANADDGVNPLLRRNDRPDASSRAAHQATTFRIPNFVEGRHGEPPMAILGDLMEFLPALQRSGPFHVQIHNPPGMIGFGEPRNTLVRSSRHESRREPMIQEPHQAVAFSAHSTRERYDEEAHLIFGSSMINQANKLSTIITAKLTPKVMELEQKRIQEEEERKKKVEEERKKEEEERRLRQEKEAEEKAARERQEAEERAEAERAIAEAAAAAAANRPPEPSPSNEEKRPDSSIMEGIEATTVGSGAPPSAIASSTEPTTSNEPRVTTIIQNREVDVTDLGIDPDYLAALPEEFREEVIAQAVTERRSQAREEAQQGGEATEVFQEFLDVLPPHIRREIEQQEAQEQRRRGVARPSASLGDGRVNATVQGIPDEMDAASILLTFPPALREQVLLEQGEEFLDRLPPEMTVRARAMAGGSGAPPVLASRGAPGIPRPPGQPTQVQSQDNKVQKRTVVQMLDKAGVATLVRLMFIAQQGSIRSYLFNVFSDVCENRQNRVEVVSTILQILQEGSVDMHAVERSFGQLSLKAKKTREGNPEQKTPQSFKRTLTTLGSSLAAQANSETSPLLIVQQCLDLLVELCTKNQHIHWLFLMEHDSIGATLKRSLSRKGKGKEKDSKAQKYPINSLLTLLDRELVMESSVVMTHLADLLNRVTTPLLNLERRRKEAEERGAAEGKGQEKPTKGIESTNEGASEKPSEEPSAAVDTAQGVDVSSNVVGQEEPKKSSPPKPRPLDFPVIPAQNLTLVVRVFVARECSSKTFQNTISTIKNLSAVPGAKVVFGQELVRQARILSENIVSDLDNLLPHIERATSGTEIQGVALDKFSPGASEQNKLLRVLTALDHLFESKKRADESDDSRVSSEKHDLVTSLYHNSTFSSMWDKLGACLSAIHERENMFNVATILLPLIESLMVVCKNTTTQDDPANNQDGKDMVLTSPPPESRTASLFFSFTDNHRRILNELVRSNPKLMSGTFALLVKNPKVLEFDNKRNYFNRSVHSRTGGQDRTAYPTLQLSVRRDHVFHDSFRSLYFKTGDEIKFGKLSIKFHGEEGVDAGGVTREWFQVLARQMFDPNYALFIPVSSDRTTFHPNKLSGVNDEHLFFFKFIGRIIGKALYEGRLLDCYFSRAVYKRILGKSVSVKDMESFDPDYYKSLCWMLENDITDIITEAFSVEDDEFGVTNVVDLIPNGRDVPVTEENKHEYVRLVVEHKLLSSVKEQMEEFLTGFHEIIPAELISIFNEQELELLISGLPDIDIDDWKANTEYHNYNPSSQQIQWFWRAVRSFDKEERAKLLQFVTGTSKVPLNGFKELEGMNGVNRFNIHRDPGEKDRLPTSHTCFNQLDIPEYESYDSLRSQFHKAITAGSEYFGFA